MSRPRLPALALLPATVAVLAAPALAGPRDSAPAAGGPRTIAVVGFALDDRSDAAAAKLSRAGEQVVRDSGRHQLRDLAELVDPARTQAARDQAADARKAYDLARRYYDELEVGKAAENCDKALALFEKADLSVSFDQLVRTSVLRIAALIANGDNKTAGVELNLLLPLDLSTPFDPNLFAPDFIGLVKRRREEIRAKSTLALDVQSRPAPARVYLDGVYRGITPVELRGLAPGDHFLTVVAPGYQLFQKRVRPGVNALERISLEPAPRLKLLLDHAARVRKDPAGSGLADAAADLAQQLGVDEVLAVGVGKGGGASVRAVAVRVDAQGKELGYLEDSMPADEARLALAAEPFFARVLDGRARRIGADGPGWTRRHTGYALTGAGVAAAGGGLVFGLIALDWADKDRLENRAQTYQESERVGRLNALGADLCYIGALALGGTGLYLLLTADEPERGPAPAFEAAGDSSSRKPARSRKGRGAAVEDHDLRDD